MSGESLRVLRRAVANTHRHNAGAKRVFEPPRLLGPLPTVAKQTWSPFENPASRVKLGSANGRCPPALSVMCQGSSHLVSASFLWMLPVDLREPQVKVPLPKVHGVLFTEPVDVYDSNDIRSGFDFHNYSERRFVLSRM